ncbi:MAG: hypothetical protein O3C40_35970 [Planctomycetota bacterium]|nr:hypothetical protein [Planctomycetota bacterium]
MLLSVLWEHAVETYRESTLLLKRLADAEGATHYEFVEFPQAVREFYTTLIAVRPELTEQQYKQIVGNVLERQERYNAFLALLNKEASSGARLEGERFARLIDYQKTQLVNWIETNLLEPIAGCIRDVKCTQQKNEHLLETTQKLFELKPKRGAKRDTQTFPSVPMSDDHTATTA